MRQLAEKDKPISPYKPVYDAKWRYFWKIGERPEEASDNFPQVLPKDFPEWEEKMDKWGYKLLDAVHCVSEMAALGMGLDKNAFTDRL
jgi:isopenicillin N synthase-like dioxygenase